MKIKKFFVFAFFLFFLVLSFGRITNASAMSTSDLNFKLSKVIEIGDLKLITVKVTNNSSSTEYSFGWVNSCELIVQTSEGSYTHGISSGTIKQGTKEYTYTLSAPGEIESIKYTDIRKLDSSGLPLYEGMSYVSADINVVIGSYYFLNAVPLMILSVVILVALIIIIAILKRKRGSGIVRFVGTTLNLIGIVTLIYAGYSFIVKPVLGQADFMDVAQRYWFLWIIGMIVTAIGQSLRRKAYGGGSSYSSPKSNNYNSRSTSSFDDDSNRFMRETQQRQFDEQNRLFQEQMQRDMEQAQRDQQQAIEQTQRDAQQAMDQMNQQNFDNFNNF